MSFNSEFMRVEFLLQTLSNGRWVLVQSGRDEAPFRVAVDKLRDSGSVDGIRLTRRVTRTDFDCVYDRDVARWSKPGVAVPDPWMPIVVPGSVAVACETPEDLVSDDARALIFAVLGKYLEENTLTLVELLHSDRAADRIMSSGALVQTVMQRIAVVQVFGTQKPPSARMKELEALVSARVRRLKTEAQAGAPVTLRPGKFQEAMLSIEAQHSGAEARYHQFKALTHYLSAGKSWNEKFELLFQLYEPHLSNEHASLFDAIGSEILIHASAVREILPVAGRRRADLLLGLVDMLQGEFHKPLDQLPIGLRALGKLLRDDGMPRCREALRERLLREIVVRQNLTNDGVLSDEMQALNAVVKRVEATSPGLGAELEFAEAVRERVDRMTHVDNISEYLQGAKPLSDKLDRLLALAESSPIELGRQRVAEPLRNVMKADDLVRDYVAPLKDRSMSIPTLSTLANRFASIGFDTNAQAEFVNAIDGILTDVVRNEATKGRGSQLERMQKLIRLCTQPPLPPGRARKLASEVIRQVLATPEFAQSYAERFPSEVDREAALAKLKDILRDAGLFAN